MTDISKRREIDALVDQVIADPSRADSVKEALKHIMEGGERRVDAIAKRPARFEVEDFFDNMPV